MFCSAQLPTEHGTQNIASLSKYFPCWEDTGAINPWAPRVCGPAGAKHAYTAFTLPDSFLSLHKRRVRFGSVLKFYPCIKTQLAEEFKSQPLTLPISRYYVGFGYYFLYARRRNKHCCACSCRYDGCYSLDPKNK